MDQSNKNLLIRQDCGGTYCLGFLNKHAMEIEEIRTIFSAFGEVLNIKETGDKTGYRFVRYQYADEAENAVDGLKTHPKIKLVEHRPKPNKKPENQRNENKIQNGNRKYKNKNFNGNGDDNKYQNGNGYYKKSNQNFNENFEEETQNGNGYYKKSNQNFNQNFEEETQNGNGVNEEVDQNSKFYTEEYQVQNDLKSKTSNCKENSSNENLLYNAKSSNSLNSIPDNNKIKPNANSLTSSLSNESLNVEGNHSKFDIPDLVRSEKLQVVNNAPKKTILNAEEIIVGNIPNDFGSAFILHLFERYNPIAISDINFVSNSGIRYCHVYFKTVHDSLVVEKTFDRMNLAGQKLLVLRPCQLIQEALC